jgi:hypothetical protein
MLEVDEFRFQVGSGPEQCSVQWLATDGPDQPFHMGHAAAVSHAA